MGFLPQSAPSAPPRWQGRTFWDVVQRVEAPRVPADGAVKAAALGCALAGRDAGVPTVVSLARGHDARL